MAIMSTNLQLSFLQERIQEIGSAIFFNLSDSVLKLPTSIVRTLKVDDYGFIWFFIQKPRQNVKEFEVEFPVKLDFFRKGKNYFLQVAGKGWVVTDPEEINLVTKLAADEKNNVLNEMVLVKVKITRAEYYEPKINNTSWWQNAMSTFIAWFRSSNNNYRPDIYFPAS